MAKKSKKFETKAHEMAAMQKEISIAEFFEKNRHLLGFDNKRKALMTTVKEGVDNSIDACEEAKILPEILVEIIDMGGDRFKVIIEDNGPGILKKTIPKIFAKLLYGSKFHRLRMSRGQQGIGISASVMYGQLTTGRAAKITSKIHPNKPAHYYELGIDTSSNKPHILKENEINWKKDHGTRVEIDLEGSYLGGSQSIDQYLKQTAITNPHVTIIYTNPKAQQLIFPRATEQLPRESKEIKPHPYGVELGVLIKMISNTDSRTIQSFLSKDFSRVGSGTAKEICKNAAILPNTKPRDMTREMSEKLMKGIQQTRIINPPTDCLSPIGEELLEKGLRKEINAEFYCAASRPPNVYRGNPFQMEVAIAYGGEQRGDKSINVYRYANKVPLLYQQGACASFKAITQTNWRPYGLSQSQGSLPIGPCTVVVHMASVWVPFTSESKEAIAHYPEIIKEMKLALQECGRKLSSYIHKKKRIHAESQKRSYIEKYIPHVALGLKELLDLKKADELKIREKLKGLLEQKRGKLKKIGEIINPEYDEEFAKIGKIVEKEIEEKKEEEKLEEKKRTFEKQEIKPQKTLGEFKKKKNKNKSKHNKHKRKNKRKR
tara:strand:- start:4135 stop:5943 length:1809 start_codon:yes stop_codon:yes gene_type:complete